jgi:hypothetical protein
VNKLKGLALFVFAACLAGGNIYGLWYIHNDSPFLASMLAGLLYVAQVKTQVKVLGKQIASQRNQLNEKNPRNEENALYFS